MSRKILVSAMMMLTWTTLAMAQPTGKIEGRIVAAADGAGIGGATVTCDGLTAEQITSDDGAFAFVRVPAGSATLTWTLADFSATEEVEVTPGATATVIKAVDWALSFADSITVFAASRKRERIVEAPAAISTVTRDDLELEAAAGQLPKLLEFHASAEVAQSGLYDFNLNVRGLNASLNRRVQMIIDGREGSNPIASNVEWPATTCLLDDLASVELVRGPSSALYGPNAFNGVLNVTTKTPRANQGGMLRLTGGELETAKLDFRWAGDLEGGWYLKALGQVAESDDFTSSRNATVEYDGLDQEAIPVPDENIRIGTTSLRLDKYFENSNLLTVEGGISDIENFNIIVNVGRAHIPDFERRWARVNYNSLHWNLLGFYNEKHADDQQLLGSGALAFEDSYSYRFELQTNRSFANGRGRLVGGVSYGQIAVDTADHNGNQSTFFEAALADQESVFGQLDFDLSDRLSLVLAGRWDDSSLHDPELSPKGSLVWAIKPHHTLRFGYNEAFQIGTFVDFFLGIPIGPPIDLSFLEVELGPVLGGVDLGLGAIPLLAAGNPDLAVEKIRSFELGYNGILGQRAFLTIDYYFNKMKDFITAPLPGGNPNFRSYVAPAALPPEVAALVAGILNQILPGLTNDASGAPALIVSPGNRGLVDSQGLELSLSYDIQNEWFLSFSYSWFDFDDKDESVGVARPNTARNRLAFGVNYRSDRLRAAIRYRWSDDYEWASGIFSGPVPSYDVINLSAEYPLSDRWTVGTNISNLLDNEHYEVFGGDLLERRALVFFLLSW